MNSNKKVLNYCPNFYKIVNFNYDDNDYITDKLVTIYKDYIFKADISNGNVVEQVKKIDYVLSRYIDDYLFRKELNRELPNVKIKKNCSDILKAIVDSVIEIFNNYQEYSTRRIYISRWIWFIFFY